MRISFIVFRVTNNLCIKRYVSVTVQLSWRRGGGGLARLSKPRLFQMNDGGDSNLLISLKPPASHFCALLMTHGAAGPANPSRGLGSSLTKFFPELSEPTLSGKTPILKVSGPKTT